MSELFSYTAFAMKPEDWTALAGKGYSVEVAIPLPPAPAQHCKSRNPAVTAAAAEYARECLTHLSRSSRRGILKAIAAKYGIRKNAISTRLYRAESHQS